MSEGKATLRAARQPGTGGVSSGVADRDPEADLARARLIFSAHDVGPWPEGFTVRREEIYGDDGR